MPKLRKTENETKNDFLRAYIAKNMSLQGISNKKALAEKIGISDRCMYYRLNRPENFTLAELRRLTNTLHFTPEEVSKII